MDHDEHEHDLHIEPLESSREYFKFAGVILSIVVMSLLIAWLRGWEAGRFLNDFMATFLVTFAAFKFINLEIFAIAYQGYDIIAKRFHAWAYIFPFIEAGLGFAYLMSNGSALLNIITIIVTGVAGIGVLKELSKKTKIMCACLGTVIRLPLSKVSFVEDFLMLAMAAGMLIIS